MNDVRAISGSAVVQPAPQPYEKPKRDGDKESRSRRERSSKASEAEISEPEIRKLDVSA
jgi:hypothetical protein